MTEEDKRVFDKGIQDYDDFVANLEPIDPEMSKAYKKKLTHREMHGTLMKMMMAPLVLLGIVGVISWKVGSE
jgi:hypothetical protein